MVQEVCRGATSREGVEALLCDKHPESYEEEPGEMLLGSVSLDKRKILTGDWVLETEPHGSRRVSSEGSRS